LTDLSRGANQARRKTITIYPGCVPVLSHPKFEKFGKIAVDVAMRNKELRVLAVGAFAGLE